MLDAVWEERLEPEIAHLAALLPKQDMAAYGDRLATVAGWSSSRGCARPPRSTSWPH